MTINLRTSQFEKRCNEATVRADWQQNFVLKDGACATFTGGLCTNQEQLTTRFERIPGKAWKITDLQGDNGTLPAGLPPGPNVLGGANFDLKVENFTVSPNLIGTLPGTINVDISNAGPSPPFGGTPVIPDAT